MGATKSFTLPEIASPRPSVVAPAPKRRSWGWSRQENLTMTTARSAQDFRASAMSPELMVGGAAASRPASTFKQSVGYATTTFKQPGNPNGGKSRSSDQRDSGVPDRRQTYETWNPGM